MTQIFSFCFADLLGEWQVQRQISDGSRFTGVAVFSPVNSGQFLYVESGILQLPQGQNLAAQRRYFYREQPNGFAVMFDEAPPRLFHNIILSRTEFGMLAGSAKHICGADHYSSQYEFLSMRQYKIRHQVKGPKKAYSMVTDYIKSQ